jgi:hypothetical protein
MDSSPDVSEQATDREDEREHHWAFGEHFRCRLNVIFHLFGLYPGP